MLSSNCCVRWGYRGVIIGWDEEARAPERWLREMHKKEPEWRNQLVELTVLDLITDFLPQAKLRRPGGHPRQTRPADHLRTTG